MIFPVNPNPPAGSLPNPIWTVTLVASSSLTLDLPATSRSAPRKQAAYPAENSCSGLVPSPLPPISFGGRVSRSMRPSDDFTWPSRPPPVAVDSVVKTTSMLMGFDHANPAREKEPRAAIPAPTQPWLLFGGTGFRGGPVPLWARGWRRRRRGGRWRRTGTHTRTHPRTAGHHRHHRRAAGSHPGTTWSARPAGDDEQPLPGSRWRRTAWASRTEHAVVVMAVVLVPGDRGTGEEDRRDDEDDAGDDHHPRGGLVEPARRCRIGRRWRWRRRRGLGCFGHASIMREKLMAAPDHARDQQDRRGDEDDSRDDRDPSRYLVEPVGPRRCLSHPRMMPQTAGMSQTVGSPAPHLRDAGLVVMPLRAGRSRGRRDGLRRLPGSGDTGAGAASTLRTAVPAVMEHRGVVMSVVVPVVALMAGDPEAGEENGRDDEQNAGHNHDPGREPVEPVRLLRGGRRRSGGRPCGWCFRCFTHA